MPDMKEKLGRALLKSMVDRRENKGDLSLEDVGGIFMEMASSLNPQGSKVDQFMHNEIAKLVNYIHDAKDEIFAIATNEKGEVVINDASQHLDEVIKHTAEATNTIMDAADAIQKTVGGVGGEKEAAIMDATNRIYDACNFQDITGQRINKVIKLLSNIEDRIGKLNELFGTELPAPAEGNGSATVLPMNDKDLLNGPQLKSKASSQEEIDALFASLGGKN